MIFGNGNFAATVSFARVLAGATVVTGFAATLPLTVVLAFATMLGRRRTTAMAFAGVLAGATIVAGIASSLALAVIHAFARVFITAFVRCIFRINAATLRTGNNPSYSTEQQFVEISSFHTHPRILHNPRKCHIYPTRNHDTHPATRYAAISVSGQDVPNHRGLAAKLTPHGNVHGAIQANASAYKSRRRTGTSPLDVLLRRSHAGCQCDNLARHRVVLQAVECTVCRVAGFLRNRFFSAIGLLIE